MSNPYFLDMRVIKDKKKDLLGFYEEMDKILHYLNYFNLFLVSGVEGSGKTSFLNLLKNFLRGRKVNLLNVNNFIGKRSKKLDGEIILIDDFDEFYFLDFKELLSVFDSLKNKKLIVSCNLDKLKNWEDKDKKKLIFSFLSKFDYIVRLEKFYSFDKINKIISEFENYLKNKFLIEISKEEREILYFVMEKQFKNDLRSIKKFLLSLIAQLDLIKKQKKEIVNLKSLIPQDIVISYMWDKELSKSDKVNIEKLLSQNLMKMESKKEEIMDLNSLINKYQRNGEYKHNLEEIIKNNPNLIEENIILNDYFDNLVFKGVNLNEIVTKKPRFIGYKDNKLYLIYLFEDLEKLPLKELDILIDNKINKDEVKIVLVTVNNEKNRNIIEKLNLHRKFNVVFV